MIMHIFF